MLSVALWSKFPTSYVRDKIEPKLEKRGISVVKHLFPNTKSIDLRDIDVVLCMNEYASHSETQRLTDLCGKDIRIVSLSRKESFWDRNLAILHNLELEMPRPKSVPDTEVEKFCHRYMELVSNGSNNDQIVSGLSHLWKGTKLTSFHQLSGTVRKLLKEDRCPSFFKEFWTNHRKEQKLAQEQVIDELQTSPEKTEFELFQELSEEEIKKRDLIIKDLNLTINTLKNKGVTPGISVDEKNSKFILIVANMVDSVKLGLNNKETAFDCIATNYTKIHTK